MKGLQENLDLQCFGIVDPNMIPEPCVHTFAKDARISHKMVRNIKANLRLGILGCRDISSTDDETHGQ
jgi:hypothetical protein